MRTPAPEPGRTARRPAPLVAVFTLLSLALGACASVPEAPPPLPLPSVVLGVRHLPASDAEASRTPGAALSVRVRLVACEFLAGDALEPLVSRTRWIHAIRGARPLPAMPDLTRDALCGSDIDDPDRWFDSSGSAATGRVRGFEEVRTVLPPAVAVDVRAAENRPGVAPGDNSRGVEVRIAHADPATVDVPDGTSGVEVTVVVEDLTSIDGREVETSLTDLAAAGGTVAEGPAGEPAAEERALQREVVHLDPLAVSTTGKNLVLVLPSPFQSSPARAVAAIVELRRIAPGSEGFDGAVAEELDRVFRHLEEARSSAAHEAVATANPAAVWPGVQRVLEEIAAAVDRRRPLLFVAEACGAAVAADVLLAGSDATVELLGERLLATDDPVSSRESLGWVLDRLSYVLLCETFSEGRAPLELEALLTLHAGEVGRQPLALEEVVNAARNREDLEERLRSENLLFLEDSSPAPRVRAFDWLLARGQAPADYDPLGTIQERRGALLRLVNQDDPSGETR